MVGRRARTIVTLVGLGLGVALGVAIASLAARAPRRIAMRDGKLAAPAPA